MEVHLDIKKSLPERRMAAVDKVKCCLVAEFPCNDPVALIKALGWAQRPGNFEAAVHAINKDAILLEVSHRSGSNETSRMIVVAPTINREA
jgi:hypothetical protein